MLATRRHEQSASPRRRAPRADATRRDVEAREEIAELRDLADLRRRAFGSATAAGMAWGVTVIVLLWPIPIVAGSVVASPESA